MTLKEFCNALQQCAEKLEEEIKYNINDINNLVYSNRLNETKMALEKAKDYHYKEIMDSIGDILKNIKKIVFHQDKIEWLSKESNFTKDELRRFSYVKRQVFAFSNPEEVAAVPTRNVKKETRRTASEVSVGSLDAWEKYLDQKDKGEKELQDTVAELKPLVAKRTLSNARRRKKFVSSTLGGFLEGDERSRNLDSIFEDASSTEENERLSYSKSLESLDKMILSDEQSVVYNGIQTENELSENHSVNAYEDSNDVVLMGSLKTLHDIACGYEVTISTDVGQSSNNMTEPIIDDEDNKIKSDAVKNTLALDTEINSDIINIINTGMPEDDDSINNEIVNTFLNDSSAITITGKKFIEEPTKEKVKPKIVDVIYKKKTS